MRRAFVCCLLESIEEAHLLDFLYNPRFSPSDSPMRQFGYYQKVISFLSDLDLHFFDQIITNLCDEFELKLLDRSHAALVLDIAFQVSRIGMGKCAENIHSDKLKQSDSIQSSLSQPLVAKIKANTGISIKDSELGYLIASLEKASERRHSMIFEEGWNLDSFEREKLLEKIPLEVLNTVEKFVTTISLQLHPAIQVDVELIRSLSSHMYHIMQYKSVRKQTPNPLYESVIQQYSYVSQVVTENTFILNTLLQQELMDVEIAYISMYVAASMERLFIPSTKKKVLVVADRSRATISLLTSRLRFEFQNLEITGVQSYLDYRKNPFKFEHDLVITTNSITGASTPILMVNPLLSSEDISRLKEFMRPSLDLAYPTSSKIKISKGPAKKIRLQDLLRQETVRCKVEASSWEEVVDQATNSLYRLHKIEHRYVISIKEIIRKSGPYMVIWPGVVLLHALPEDGVRELCMSLITLRSPVYFGHQYHDPVEIAIVLGAVDKTSHLPALFDLNELVQNENAKSNLTNTFHKSRLLAEISKFRYSHIH
jgi:mannitol/fructose-specific phosphotransferase system IIA component (Ntr-type)